MLSNFSLKNEANLPFCSNFKQTLMKNEDVDCIYDGKGICNGSVQAA